MKKRILIVDDNPGYIQLLANILKKYYEVNVAQNGLQCIELSKRVNPNLILLDIVMPGMDGYETFKKLKQIPETQDIPVIFLTAKTDSSDIVKGFNLGASDYVTKPCNSEVLQARVKTHILLAQKSRELKMISEIDGLTRIPNRKRFNEFLELKWRKCLKKNLSLSLMLIDIDYFKEYNDTYGHINGDKILKKIAQTISSHCRKSSDLASRFGGEEFALILEKTNEKETSLIANKIKININNLNISHKSSKILNILSVSIGTASIIPTKEKNENYLVNLADKALYKAKQSGKNKIITFSE